MFIRQIGNGRASHVTIYTRILDDFKDFLQNLLYFNLISIFELKIARPSLVCSFKIYEWSLEDGDLNTQLFSEVEHFMKTGIVTVVHLLFTVPIIAQPSGR